MHWRAVHAALVRPHISSTREPSVKVLFPILASFVLLIVAIPVRADTINAVVYDNGLPTGGGVEATQWIQASDFTFIEDTIVNAISFYTIELTDAPAYQGSVYYWIYGNDALTNTPDETNILFEALLNPLRFFWASTTTPGYDVYRYNVLIPSLDLAAGTYWLALHNGPLSTTFRAEWYWAATDDKSTTFTGLEDIAPFDGVWAPSSRQETAFALWGPVESVPEPATLLLLGIGLARLAGKTRARDHR
jgi:hypothetical protein